MGLALASSRSNLELAGVGFIGHGGSFWQFLAEATLVAPPPREQTVAHHKAMTSTETTFLFPAVLQ